MRACISCCGIISSCWMRGWRASAGQTGWKYAHATVATSWITAYFVRNFQNTISKFYFIQDFEPYFYAHGSEYSFAENTYSFGFRGITAGDWLRDIAREQYGMKAMSFHFSYDRTIYYPKDKPDDRPRVFFLRPPGNAQKGLGTGGAGSA